MCKEKTMTNFKTSSWYVDANGVAQPQTTKYHEDRYEAERQYHLFCAAAATSVYPTHVALLETIDGIQIKRECYKHEVEV
jgi:hypothetical protein